jgi:hypothetical protein
MLNEFEDEICPHPVIPYSVDLTHKTTFMTLWEIRVITVRWSGCLLWFQAKGKCNVEPNRVGNGLRFTLSNLFL